MSLYQGELFLLQNSTFSCCVKVPETTSSWLEARQICKSLQIAADLPVLSLQSNEELIVQFANESFWIGAHRLLNQQSDYEWVNGNEIVTTYSNWATNGSKIESIGYVIAYDYFLSGWESQLETQQNVSLAVLCCLNEDDRNSSSGSSELWENVIYEKKQGESNVSSLYYSYCDFDNLACPEIYSQCGGINFSNDSVCNALGQCVFSNESKSGVCECFSDPLYGPLRNISGSSCEICSLECQNGGLIDSTNCTCLCQTSSKTCQNGGVLDHVCSECVCEENFVRSCEDNLGVVESNCSCACPQNLCHNGGYMDATCSSCLCPGVSCKNDGEKDDFCQCNCTSSSTECKMGASFDPFCECDCSSKPQDKQCVYGNTQSDCSCECDGSMLRCGANGSPDETCSKCVCNEQCFNSGTQRSDCTCDCSTSNLLCHSGSKITPDCQYCDCTGKNCANEGTLHADCSCDCSNSNLLCYNSGTPDQFCSFCNCQLNVDCNGGIMNYEDCSCDCANVLKCKNGGFPTSTCFACNCLSVMCDEGAGAVLDPSDCSCNVYGKSMSTAIGAIVGSVLGVLVFILFFGVLGLALAVVIRMKKKEMREKRNEEILDVQMSDFDEKRKKK